MHRALAYGCHLDRAADPIRHFSIYTKALGENDCGDHADAECRLVGKMGDPCFQSLRWATHYRVADQDIGPDDSLRRRFIFVVGYGVVAWVQRRLTNIGVGYISAVLGWWLFNWHLRGGCCHAGRSQLGNAVPFADACLTRLPQTAKTQPC